MNWIKHKEITSSKKEKHKEISLNKRKQIHKNGIKKKWKPK